MKSQRVTAIGVFNDRHTAQEAVNELRRAGFREDQIGVAGRDGETVTGAHDTQAKGSHAAAGAATGVAAGAGVGALWGIGILAGLVPGIGPAIAGGTLGVLLSSAAAGAAAAGLAGALIGLGLPEEEAKYYEGEFHAGRIIVSVKADGRYDEALATLRRCGGYDYSTNSERSAAATTSKSSSRTAAEQCATGAAAGNRAGKVVQAKEEQLHVSKQSVGAGEVSVRKEVHTEQRTIQVPVKKEEIVIERHNVSGRPVAAGDMKEGEEIRIPVREEQVHIEKRPVVTEEVSIGKREVEEIRPVTGTVRKEQIKVEKKGDVNVKETRS